MQSHIRFSCDSKSFSQKEIPKGLQNCQTIEQFQLKTNCPIYGRIAEPLPALPARGSRKTGVESQAHMRLIASLQVFPIVSTFLLPRGTD
jgi:hypothetical protein